MSGVGLVECTEHLRRHHDPTPAVSVAVRRKRCARATELDEVWHVVNRGEIFSEGFRSATDWLVVTTGEAAGHCKGTVTMADRIRRMPLIKATFADGVLAESNLRLLCEAWCDRIADAFARDEEMLCDWAVRLPHRDFTLVLDTWRMHVDPDREARTAQEQFDSRSLHLSKLLDGMGRIDGTLDPEGRALVDEAIRAMSQPAEGETRSAAQRRADALIEMARLTLTHISPQPGKKRRRPKVIATIDHHDLADGTNGGVIDTDNTTAVVPAEAIRRMACDCDLHRYISDPLGAPIDFGRRTRLISDALFDTLMVRDHGCRWPGCSVPAGSCDAHHARHWLDGGETKPDNLVLLCWFHHHLLHEQHWSIEPHGAGHFTLSSPRVDTQSLRPPQVGLALPLAPTLPSN